MYNAFDLENDGEIMAAELSLHRQLGLKKGHWTEAHNAHMQKHFNASDEGTIEEVRVLVS